MEVCECCHVVVSWRKRRTQQSARLWAFPARSAAAFRPAGPPTALRLSSAPFLSLTSHLCAQFLAWHSSRRSAASPHATALRMGPAPRSPSPDLRQLTPAGTSRYTHPHVCSWKCCLYLPPTNERSFVISTKCKNMRKKNLTEIFLVLPSAVTFIVCVLGKINRV